MLAWDRRGRLRPVALQSPEADELLADMGDEQRMRSWHFADPASGEVESAGAAFAPLLRELPGGSPLAAAAERAPSLMQRGYRFVSSRRDKFGPRLSDGAKSRADRRIAARS